ncbi:MAG TPA: M20/M25/M40 family metallo-hydrolase, partial [Candidatus Methylomirabilis sp.]|nr:M20/M25/M40 family metallo-hydrolase [Candidatus Methylomirabilis sp.]
GNVTAIKRGRQERPRLMLAAHLDEIGFIVKAVDPRGFLSFDRIGGMGDAILPCRRVSVNGHFGIIGAKSGHLLSAEEQNRPPVVADMYIDVGAASAAEVAAMGIRVGDPVTFIGELAEFTGGDRVCAKAMDDRMGVAILIQVLTELAGVTPQGSVFAVATVLEQVGLRGAAMTAPRIAPDYAVAIDGLSAGDTPDSSLTRDIPLTMGQGPAVLLASSSTALHIRGSIAHPAMKRHLLAAAEAEGVPVQLVTHMARGSTDAAAIHLTTGGIPTISIGVPRRYSYSPNEVVDLNDLAGAVRVLVRFVGDMPKHHDLEFV